jgi:hypothetical protein
MRVAVAAITHAPPGNRSAVPLPSATKKHLHLDSGPSWVICDEINHFEWPGFDFGRTPSGASTYGRLPAKILQRIMEALRDTALKAVDRD